jgi:formylmethanofuran dehydrogenase subunit E
MKRIFFSIILSLLSFISIGQQFITTQNINVRKGPSPNYETIGVLSIGETIEIIENKGKWGKILFEGNEAYISTKYLQSPNSSITETAIKNKSKDEIGTPTTLQWIVGIIVSILLLKIFGFRKIISTVAPKTTESIIGKFKCTQCGRVTFGRDKKVCPNGGNHNWYKI